MERDRGDDPTTKEYTGKFGNERDYENIPLRASGASGTLKIKIVAEVEFGTTYFDVEVKFNGNLPHRSCSNNCPARTRGQ